MHTHWGGGQQPHISDGELDFGPNNDLYTPFSSSSREWLSNNHIIKYVLYMLHMRYPKAKHHNMAGVTHPVACVQELLHKVKQANENSPLEYSTDISQALRDALSPDGPSPAITIGDNIHWIIVVLCTSHRTVQERIFDAVYRRTSRKFIADYHIGWKVAINADSSRTALVISLGLDHCIAGDCNLHCESHLWLHPES